MPSTREAGQGTAACHQGWTVPRRGETRFWECTAAPAHGHGARWPAAPLRRPAKALPGRCGRPPGSPQHCTSGVNPGPLPYLLCRPRRSSGQHLGISSLSLLLSAIATAGAPAGRDLRAAVGQALHSDVSVPPSVTLHPGWRSKLQTAEPCPRPQGREVAGRGLEPGPAGLEGSSAEAPPSHHTSFSFSGKRGQQYLSPGAVLIAE